MSLLIGTLCLNEMEWLPRLYEQHKNWPGLTKWVFVESADIMYAQANPGMVNRFGLSTDGTTEYLQWLATEDDRIIHIPMGISSNRDPAQGKCEARQRYMDVANEIQPNWILTLDADEFYTLKDQEKMLPSFKRWARNKNGVTLPYRNIWRPESIQDQPLFQFEITGKLWGVVVCKFWRWQPGIKYDGNHNSPTVNGKPCNKNLKKLHKLRESKHVPQFIHMGFASRAKTRTAKNRYYVERGEGKTDHRGHYVKSRASFEGWLPGDELANDDKIVSYTGPIPEVFQGEDNVGTTGNGKRGL